MRVYQCEPLYTKIFIELVVLIIWNKISTNLKNRMKATGKNANYKTVLAAIKELSKIEMVKQVDGIYRLNYAVTASQKEILQAFNLATADVKKQAVELAGLLRTLTT